MKKVIAKKVIITATGTIMVLSLAGCGQNNSSQTVNGGTSIQEVNNGAGNKITATGELKEKQNKTKEQNKKEDKQQSKINYKKQMDEMRKQTLKQLEEVKAKISKGKINNDDIMELTNLYYNKQLLPKDKQAEVDKLYNKVKIAKIQQIIKQVKNSKIPSKYKQQIINILQKKMKDKNTTIDEVNMIAQNIKGIETRFKNPKISARYTAQYKAYLVNRIKTTSKTDIKKEIVNNIKPSDLKQIKFKSSPNISIDTTKVEKYIINKIKDISKQIANVRTKGLDYITLQDFNTLVSLATNDKNIKTINKTIINQGYMGVADIPYVVYKGKPIDVNSILLTLKTVKLLQSAGLSNIIKGHIYLTKDKITGLYAVGIDKSLDTSGLMKYVKLYLAVKNIPGIVDLTAKVYNINTDNMEVILNRIYDLITGSFIDYTNIEDSGEFNNLVNKLNKVFSNI